VVTWTIMVEIFIRNLVSWWRSRDRLLKNAEFILSQSSQLLLTICCLDFHHLHSWFVWQCIILDGYMEQSWPEGARYAKLSLIIAAEDGWILYRSMIFQKNTPHSAKDSMSRQSPLLTLQSFLSTDGLIHVGGRLANFSMDYAEKHLVVLARHHLSFLTGAWGAHSSIAWWTAIDPKHVDALLLDRVS